MKKLLDVLPWALFVLAMGSLIYLFNSMHAKVEKARQPSNVQAMQELEGKTFHWIYPAGNGEDSGTFHVLVKEKRLFFQCVDGAMKGISASVNPQFSKIAKGVYFLSWQTPMGGGDSIVINFNTKEIHAHVKAMGRFWGMRGTITCNGLKEDCAAPNIKNLKVVME